MPVEVSEQIKFLEYIIKLNNETSIQVDSVS